MIDRIHIEQLEIHEELKHGKVSEEPLLQKASRLLLLIPLTKPTATSSEALSTSLVDA